MFALYQLTLFVGLLLLPVAVLARQMGVSLRFDRALRRLDAAYDEAQQG
jgi:hypothetical protein